MSWPSPQTRPARPATAAKAPRCRRGCGLWVGEAQAGAGDEILDGARDQHLTRAARCRYLLSDLHRDARDVAVALLDLAGVRARPDLEPETLSPSRWQARAADGPGRTVEGGEETIRAALHLPPPEPFERGPDDSVVSADQFALAVLDGGRAFRRAHDGGEQGGRQHRFGSGRRRVPVRNPSASCATPVISP